MSLPLTLRKAKMISYSQLYPGEHPSAEELVRSVPTDEAIEWCSYIIFQKSYLKIGESDIHIIGPLLFSFESELQHKITDYLGNFYNRMDTLIDRYSLLRLVELLITFHNDDHHELTKAEKTRLFKAYLLFCDDYLEQVSRKAMPDKFSAKDMLENYMPAQLLTNDIENFSDPSLEVVKGKRFFVDFANTDRVFKEYVQEFVNYKGYGSAIEYLGVIFNLDATTITNDTPTNIIQFGPDSKNWISFMDNMCVSTVDFKADGTLNELRSRPVYRTANGRYAILYSKFFVDKMFSGMLFDMAQTLAEVGKFKDDVSAYQSIKQQVGERFSEHYLLYRTLENTLSKRMPIQLTGESMHKILKSGEPDYYARRSRRVLLFEFKDIKLDARTKNSCDFETIRKKIYLELVENEKGKPKGVRQIAEVIAKRLPTILSDMDKYAPDGDLQVYPVIVYTDCSFDIEGINYYLNVEFQKYLGEIDNRYKVKDLILVNLNLLMKLENYFQNKKIAFDSVVNDYLSYKNSKETLYTVPFNKFLFQYARRKGFDMKFTRSFHDTFQEIVELEKREKTSHGS